MHFIPSVDFSIEIFRFIRVKFAFSIYILHNTRDYSQLNIVYEHENKPFVYSILQNNKSLKMVLIIPFVELQVIYVGPKYVEQSTRWVPHYVICKKTVAVPPTLMN